MVPQSHISIVIPVYNRASLLQECLDSILAQDMAPAEVIVVDDGSTDGSALVAKEHPLHPLVIAGGHKGAAAARNAGLEPVKTPWVMFFDSDDLMKPHHINECHQATLTDNTDIIGWDVEQVNLDGSRHRLPFYDRDAQWHNLMHGGMATQRYMARTELVRKAGGWNPSVTRWNDIELGARLLNLNPRIKKIRPAGGYTVIQRVNARSITGTSWQQHHERYETALSPIAQTLGPGHADWIAVKRAILAADIARENAALGKEMYKSITPRPLAARMAYRWRKAGLRGIARLLRPFMSL